MKRLESSGLTHLEIARKLGWTRRARRQKRRADGSLGTAFDVEWADAQRVTRTLAQGRISQRVAQDVATAFDWELPMGRTCTACQRFKGLDAFHRAPRGFMGRKSVCRSCCGSSIHSGDGEPRLLLGRGSRSFAPPVLAVESREVAERRFAQDREYRQRPEVRAATLVRGHEYRARNGRKPSRRLTTDEREYAATLYNDPCSYCGVAAEEIDHIDALYCGGASHPDNLTASCGTCNRRKGTRSLLSFLRKGVVLEVAEFPRV